MALLRPLPIPLPRPGLRGFLRLGGGAHRRRDLPRLRQWPRPL